MTNVTVDNKSVCVRVCVCVLLGLTATLKPYFLSNATKRTGSNPSAESSSLRDNRRTSDTLSDNNRRTSDTLSDNNRRTSDTLSDNNRRTSDTLSDNNRRTRDTLNDNNRRTRDTLSDKNRRTSDTLSDNNRTIATLSDNNRRITDTLLRGYVHTYIPNTIHDNPAKEQQLFVELTHCRVAVLV